MRSEKDYLADYLPIDVEAVVTGELNYAARYKCQSEPAAILLAGQPGAGKTVLSAMLNKFLRGDVYFINADEYRRFHPNYKKLYAEYGSDSVQMTSKFSGAVTEQQSISQTIKLLRQKEEVNHLGQSASIDELERRVQEMTLESGYSFDMTM